MQLPPLAGSPGRSSWDGSYSPEARPCPGVHSLTLGWPQARSSSSKHLHLPLAATTEASQAQQRVALSLPDSHSSTQPLQGRGTVKKPSGCLPTNRRTWWGAQRERLIAHEPGLLSSELSINWSCSCYLGACKSPKLPQLKRSHWSLIRTRRKAPGV